MLENQSNWQPLIGLCEVVPPPSTAVILTSSVEDQGRVAACPGEEVVFTCRTTEAAGLTWFSDQFSNQLGFRFGPNDLQNTPVVDGSFTATLTEVIVNPDNMIFANFTSTLAVNATVDLNGTVIECNDQQVSKYQTLLVAGWHNIISIVADHRFVILGSIVIVVLEVTSHHFSIHTGMASPPLNPRSIVQTYHRHTFTVRVEWEDSTLGADTYTISSDTPMETVPGSETSVVLTLSYNMVHTVIITATLCGDISEAVTVNIYKGQVHALRTCS